MAGSAYTYVRKSIDSRVGFLEGWAILLDYLFLPMVIWLIGGSYLSAQFPGSPIAVWIVGFIVVTTLLNILGIKVADKANYALMAFQLLVIVFFVAVNTAIEVYHETLAELYDYFIPYPIEKLHTSHRDHIALVVALRARNVEEAVEVSRKHVDILHRTMFMGLAQKPKVTRD
ncbi:amino acid permease [Arthrobacter sp. CDRTa11]|uniref:amino acid permease n=1 Tax=Arthrobacter sp. CDRTa11 TaxID=2651199 RepID=UPI002B400170|nr:amino acid permease [Arthrobacter sp. CDRTa11]